MDFAVSFAVSLQVSCWPWFLAYTETKGAGMPAMCRALMSIKVCV
jgi:hypothetical protein